MRHPGLYVVLLGLILLAVALIPPWLQHQPPALLLGNISSQCITGSICTATVPDLGDVELLISPASLPHNEPLEISLDTADLVHQASFQFVGRDMYMGLMPVEMKYLSDGQFRTTTRISYCTLDNAMRWFAELRLSTDAGTYQITFELDPTK